MFEPSTQPVIPHQRCCAAVFGDAEGGPSEEWHSVEARWRGIRPHLRIDTAAFCNIRRPKLATTSIRVGASCTSLDLWYVDLDVSADALRCFRQWLSDDELVKAERFRRALVRARYMVGRAALRCVLADRLGCPPAAIRLSYGTNGKPMLEGGGGNVEFNLAHSGADAVIALAGGAAVGVDIERLQPIADVESLARLVFSDAERRELELAPDPVLAFLNGWTRKEAYVKALGLGLVAPLTEITVSLSGGAALLSTGLRDQSVNNWRLLNVPHPRGVVALALGPRVASNGTRRGETMDGRSQRKIPIRSSAAWEYAKTAQDEPPIIGRRIRSRTDSALRTGGGRVLICDPIPAEAVERMSAGGLQVDEKVGLSPEELEVMIGDYDAVVVRSATQLGERQIAAGRRLRVIVRAGVGTDNIDLPAAASRGIAVLTTPRAPTVSVAELSLGLLFALARGIPQADAALKSGRWPKREFSDGIELHGKTLGILGVGRVGGALGRRASALGMVVVGADKELEPAGRFEGLELLPLADLLPRADFISVHIPLSEDGRPQIGKEEIARMKDGVLVVNCARGGVVDEEALLEALEGGKVRGAALDVFAEEPPRNLRLVRHPRVVSTAHMGTSTREAQARIGMEIAQILLERLKRKGSSPGHRTEGGL